MKDKYSAVWVSHSSMGDFEKCPRLYYLRSMYKNPKSGKKVSTVAPVLTLGVAVHEVLEGLGEFKAEERLQRDLLAWFRKVWEKSSGKLGGFVSAEQEAEFKERGERMIQTVIKDPRFLGNKIIKLPRNTMNPNFYLSEDDNIILNGLIDWIEYLPDTDSLHIVDFKTGKKEESEGSLQLPIYMLLCNALQKRKVTKASYWYLETDVMSEKVLPTLEESFKKVYAKAKSVKDARDRAAVAGIKEVFVCPKGEGGCMHCKQMEAVVALIEGRSSSAEFVGVGNFGQEMYMVV